MKILIIRFSSIGDVVLTTPVLRCIKQQIPNAEITYLIKPQYVSVIQHNPYINHIIAFDNNIDKTIETLATQQFDVIIDLQNNFKSLKIKRGLKHIKSYSVNKLNIKKWLLTAFKINALPKISIVDRYLKTVENIGVRNDGKGLDFFIDEQELISSKDIPASHLHGYIAIVVGATLNTKKLPLNKLEELCKAINYPIILLGGKEDVSVGEKLSNIDDIRIYNACGKFSLNESTQLIQQAKLVITHDTGLMHIAAAFNKNIIAIWGNTTPSFGMQPYYGNNINKHINYEVKNLFCRPCSKIGYNNCPLKHFKCMNKQPIEQIAATALQVLK